LDKELKRWPIKFTTGPRQPAFAKEIGHGSASFTTKWYEQSPSKPESCGKVEIDLMIKDEQVKFRQIGVVAEPSKDWSSAFKQGPKPPSLVLTGIRDSDGKRLTLAMGLSIESFHPSKKPVGMIGIMIEGSLLGFMAKMMLNPSGITLIDAKATLKEASMEADEPVQGKLDFKIMQFAGGKAPKVSWEEE